MSLTMSAAAGENPRESNAPATTSVDSKVFRIVFILTSLLA
jgi:hypothetical protein